MSEENVFLENVHITSLRDVTLQLKPLNCSVGPTTQVDISMS